MEAEAGHTWGFAADYAQGIALKPWLRAKWGKLEVQVWHRNRKVRAANRGGRLAPGNAAPVLVNRFSSASSGWERVDVPGQFRHFAEERARSLRWA